MHMTASRRRLNATASLSLHPWRYWVQAGHHRSKMLEPQGSASGVNIFPERRKKQVETESSPYFGTVNDTMTSRGKERGRSPRHKQMTLTVNNGSLSTKRPLSNPQGRDDARRKPLKEIAAETKMLLPGILATRPDAEPRGYLYNPGDAPKLDPKHCPGLASTKVRVLNSDTIEAALSLPPPSRGSKPVCILNMANANTPGGGWLHGSLAQEEALCYRTSLSFTLKNRHYPLPESGGIYSPRVLLFRENMKDGHGLMDLRDPSILPVLSVVSVAAVCGPAITKDSSGKRKYVFGADKNLMEEKMRVILRMAVRNQHRQIILGAFGCGAFANPREVVAKMWATILQEQEFCGGWWEDVVFAVLDDGRGNLRTFTDHLDGLFV